MAGSATHRGPWAGCSRHRSARDYRACRSGVGLGRQPSVARVAWAIARDHAVQLDGEFYDLHAPVGVPIVDRGRPDGETYSGLTRPAAEMVGSVVAEPQGEPAADHRAESKRYESDERVMDHPLRRCAVVIVIRTRASSE